MCSDCAHWLHFFAARTRAWRRFFFLVASRHLPEQYDYDDKHSI